MGEMMEKINMKAEGKNRKGKTGMRLGIKKGKKAFLFTLGFFLVTLAILSFSKFAFKSSENEKIILQEYGVMNRLNDMDSSLQGAIRETFDIYSNIKVNPGNSSVIFEEPLPNSMDVFESRLNRLRNLAQTNDSSVMIDANGTVESMPIILPGKNLTYSHNFSAREIIISLPQDISSVMKYRTTITAEENITCEWSYLPGDFDYGLEVAGIQDSGCDHERMISLSQNPSITIQSEDNADNRITITLNASQIRIKMYEGSEFYTTVKNDLFLDGHPGSMWLGSNLIEINFTAFGLRRAGGVRVG